MTDQSQNGRNEDGIDIHSQDNQGRDDHDGVIDFGFRTVRREAKRAMVRDVFDSVAARYDVMNDLMSGGVHRLWKAGMIDWIAPQPGQTLVDLAGGTGDISQRFLNAGGGNAIVCDINEAMLAAGRQRRDMIRLAERVHWCTGNAEALPFGCLLYTSPSPRDGLLSRMPSSA